MTGRIRTALLGLALILPVAARAQEAEDCRRAIAAVEPGSGIPAGLLGAVALVESGRADPATGRPVPWPWTWNAAGEGRHAATKSEAVSAVATLLTAGTRSVDVGCMQVNLFHHPDAFPDLDAAFDPMTNVRYAARFLLSLKAQTGEWGTAVARYHSAEEARGVPYSRRVALAQLGAGWGRGGAVTLPVGVVRGLCGPGLVPALMLRPRAARSAAPTRVTCRRAR
jgi:soluble lytic murein transglycosylase-like protein